MSAATPQRARGALALVVAGALVVPAAVRAQAPKSSDCFGAVPASALRPTVAHLAVDDLGEGAPPVQELAWGHLRALNDRAARSMRTLLGASRDALPPRDTALDWRGFMGHLHVVVQRDGSFDWSYPWGAPGHRAAADSTIERGAWLAGQALASLRNGGAKLEWPDGVRGDSIVFRMRFVWPDPREDGAMGEMPVANAAPVLRLDVPAFTAMRIVKPATIAYPESSRLAEVRTTITMQFLLDTAGRVVESSIRDRWPAGRERPTGKLANYYDEFVQAVRRGILGTTYEPARFGGCRVPQQVEQDFTFGLRGRIWNDNQ